MNHDHHYPPPIRHDDLLVCLGAMAIGQATGGDIPQSGKVIYGEGQREKTVRIFDIRTQSRSLASEETKRR